MNYKDMNRDKLIKKIEDLSKENQSLKDKLIKISKPPNRKIIAETSINKSAIFIMKYLVHKTERKFNVQLSGHLKFIIARLKEGYEFDDFKTVIDKKTLEWKGTKNEVYLRPKTLFNSENFDNYLTQKEAKQNLQNNQVSDSYILHVLCDKFGKEIKTFFFELFKQSYTLPTDKALEYHAASLAEKSGKDLTAAVAIMKGTYKTN